MKKTLLLLFVLIWPAGALGQEYCYDQYQEKIRNVSADLGSALDRTLAIDGRIRAIFVRQTEIVAEITRLTGEFPMDVERIQALGAESGALEREKVELQSEAYGLQDRIKELKTVVPADLQGELRGCAEASAPVGGLVNLTIQAIAILSTGGASLLLPEKSLYVDMSAVLNGYPTGGDSSVINQARQRALDGLGIGGANNDIGGFVKDPVNTVTEFFGL